MNIVGSLPKLEVLKLVDHACHGDTWETTDGEFLELKFLQIEKSNLRCWDTETSHFPKLKCLVLHRCMYLSEIPNGIGDIPTLEWIEVDGVTKSLVDSVRQIQWDQEENYGNVALQVHCIQSDNQIITERIHRAEERLEGLRERLQSEEALRERLQRKEEYRNARRDWRKERLAEIACKERLAEIARGERLTEIARREQHEEILAEIVRREQRLREDLLSSRTLKIMPNLRKLGIVYLIDQEHHLHNLIHLNQLEKLKITMSQSFSWQGHNPVFPRTLTKLTLVGGQLPWKDMDIVGSLPKLEVLKLVDHACHGDTWETTSGEFLELKFLQIEKSNLQSWNTESSHFPKLKCLVLRQCMYLSEIPDGIGDIATLERIEVDVATKSLVDSVRQIQRDQQSYENNALQVHCIQSDQIRDSASPKASFGAGPSIDNASWMETYWSSDDWQIEMVKAIKIERGGRNN